MNVRLFALSLAIFWASSARSATLTFLPNLDTDIQPNTSGSTPYDVTAVQSATPAGIPDGTVSSYSDTYFYRDSSTGIFFEFDMEWAATGGLLNGNNNTMGIGDADIEGLESMTMSVSNLLVDLSGYIPNSISGVFNPTLTGSSIGFDQLRLGDRQYADNSNRLADESIVNITDGTSNVEWGTAAGGVGDNTFRLGRDGLPNTAQSLSVSHNAASTFDTDFRVSGTRFLVELDISETVTAVPEPSTVVFGVAFGLLCITRRRRRRKSTQESDQ